ncbi:MAG TPA: glycosyltransferase [Candidatus Eisenbergiella merdipullorum]|uniref:Glycosyltransferase n=1 Tax=Candidatus Eisenbergiella merdipullorum TaxID=2838553 RepID=A0A9D2I6C0_9FIRM|nr:glycosyltransferase [Candidatus Eisenbergiella merdipullorum]
MNGLISVIVPVYNGEKYLSDCLESLLGQTHEELEILVIDDGSADGSAALCESFARKDGRIRLIRQPNGGVSSARNRGLEEAKGDFVAFVDADDWLLPQMLEDQLEMLTREKGDMILGGYRAVGEKERESFRRACRSEKRTGGPGREEGIGSQGRTQQESSQEESLLQDGTNCLVMDAETYVNRFLLQSNSRCWSILFCRDAIGKTRFPENLSIGEDLLFLARLMPRLKRVLVTEKCGYCYFLNERGAMLSEFKPSYMDQISCWKMAEKELEPFGEEAREKIRLCLFQAALLTAGKLALLEPAAAAREYEAFLKECREAAAEAWRELGRAGRKRLPAGYRIKGVIFLHAPEVYLRLYHVWKRKS